MCVVCLCVRVRFRDSASSAQERFVSIGGDQELGLSSECICAFVRQLQHRGMKPYRILESYYHVRRIVATQSRLSLHLAHAITAHQQLQHAMTSLCTTHTRTVTRQPHTCIDTAIDHVTRDIVYRCLSLSNSMRTWNHILAGQRK